MFNFFFSPRNEIKNFKFNQILFFFDFFKKYNIFNTVFFPSLYFFSKPLYKLVGFFLILKKYVYFETWHYFFIIYFGLLTNFSQNTIILKKKNRLESSFKKNFFVLQFKFIYFKKKFKKVFSLIKNSHFFLNNFFLKFQYYF